MPPPKTMPAPSCARTTCSVCPSPRPRNEYLVRALEIYHSLSRRFWFAYNSASSNLQYCSALHADLARQIASGNPDKAVAAHDKLIKHILEVLQATITL